jgi:hypothetical protein
MSSEKYFKVYSGSLIYCLNVINELSEENITAIIKDYSESARLAGFGSLYNEKEVYVHTDEYETAIRLLRNKV